MEFFGKIYRTWKVLEVDVKGLGICWDADAVMQIFPSAHL